MKKLLSMALIAGLAVSLTACGGKKEEAAADTSSSSSAVEETKETEDTTEAEDAEETVAEADGDIDYSSITVGIIQPGPEDYYQSLTDRVVACAESVGMKTTTLLSEYDDSKELTNVEDLITQGVSCIVTQPLTSSSAQTICQMCNEADMPIYIVNATVDEGEGVPTAIVGTSFYDMGYLNGEFLKSQLDNLGGEAKVIEIQGFLGQGVADEITRGFDVSIEGVDGISVVYRTDCHWDRAEAIAAIEDQITAGIDFNVVFAHNEDMCRGVVDTLKENNLTDSVMVMAQNGSQNGFDMFKEGLLAATVSNSPSLVAGETIKAIIENEKGNLTPGESIMADVFTITADDYDDPDTITWDPSWGIALVDEYLGK